jgi:hypothetical protein
MEFVNLFFADFERRKEFDSFFHSKRIKKVWVDSHEDFLRDMGQTSFFQTFQLSPQRKVIFFTQNKHPNFSLDNFL